LICVEDDAPNFELLLFILLRQEATLNGWRNGNKYPRHAGSLPSGKSSDKKLERHVKVSASGSANGKVKRRRRDGGNGAAAKRPSPNRWRKARRSFGIRNAARDERAFLRNGTGAVVRGFGRTAPGEVEQESALVTAEASVCFIDARHDSFNVSFILGSERMDFAHGFRLTRSKEQRETLFLRSTSDSTLCRIITRQLLP